MFGAVRFNINGDRFLVNGNNHPDDNNGRSRGMALAIKTILMKRYGNLYKEICSYENFEFAYKKARKHKTKKPYVIEFEKNLKHNLLLLRTELLLHCYSPIPLVNFTIYDPKMRKISKSDFRDRVVHHALCNIIEPIFDKSFIHDSYANRKGKGTLGAIKRFDFVKNQRFLSMLRNCYFFKAISDILRERQAGIIRLIVMF
jgi:retron-type reverse transcriptase